MKKINLKKALASVAALSVVACAAAIPASAADSTFVDLTANTAGVAIEQVTLTSDEVAAMNGQVPVLVKVNPNPGVNAIEFGINCEADYRIVTDDEVSSIDGASVQVEMTARPEGDLKAGTLSWLAWASASPSKSTKQNFAIVLVTIPKAADGSYAAGTYNVTYCKESAGENAKSNVFQKKENGTATDYVASGDLKTADGFVKVVGATTAATTTTTEVTTTTTETTKATTTTTETTKATTTTTETTKATTTTEATTTTTETTKATTTTETTAATTQDTATTASTAATTQDTATTASTAAPATTAATTTTTAAATTAAASSTGSPKTGASDVLPIAGAAAAVAVLGGVALVAKKKND